MWQLVEIKLLHKRIGLQDKLKNQIVIRGGHNADIYKSLLPSTWDSKNVAVCEKRNWLAQHINQIERNYKKFYAHLCLGKNKIK